MGLGEGSVRPLAQRKGRKVILENPRGGILVKHVRAGRAPRWDRREASVSGTERQKNILSPVAAARSEAGAVAAGADFIRFQVQTAPSWPSGRGSCAAELLCLSVLASPALLSHRAARPCPVKDS